MNSGLTEPVWARRLAAAEAAHEVVLLVDFGSTFTKLTAVEAETGRLLATAQHRTTVDTDVLRGYEAGREALARLLDVEFTETLACSSAGGGLRLAVVGLEPELTVEAARRTALNAGARVVAVISRGLTSENVVELDEAHPDIVLIAGGTDGGNAAVFVESARALAESQLDVPVVLAGNERAQPEASNLLRKAGRRVVSTPNLMPEVGVIRETAAREAIRALFIHHVIGGKHLSSSGRFGEMVLMATPDAVLTATELLASGTGTETGLGDLMVIDLGGATTDVHSIVHHEHRAGYANQLVTLPEASRTVEADLGLRWNALGIIEAAAAETDHADISRLRPAAERRVAQASLVAESETELRADLELATAAVEMAVRRHAGRLTIELSPQGAALRKSGRDLRAISTVVLSGGIFRHTPIDRWSGLLPTFAGDKQIMLPRHSSLAIDGNYVLAAAGLLATRDRSAAFALASHGLSYLLKRSQEDEQCSASS